MLGFLDLTLRIGLKFASLVENVETDYDIKFSS